MKMNVVLYTRRARHTEFVKDKLGGQTGQWEPGWRLNDFNQNLPAPVTTRARCVEKAVPITDV